MSLIPLIPELAQKIRSIRPDIPIILCTGFSDAITEEKAKAIGTLEYTMKPVVKSDMARAVRRLLDQKNEKWLRHSFLS